MGKLTLHAKIELGLVAALLLGSCDGAGHTIAETYDLADVARANSSNALYEIELLKGRVSALEAQSGM